MSKLDLAHALTGENRDPFAVPGKEAEMVSFFSAAMLGVTAAIGIVFDRTNVALLGLAALALGFLARGIHHRRYRLARIRKVNELRRRLASDNA
jgi:hypothetical protein